MQKYERGANRVGVSWPVRIASVLGVSIDELFESPRLNLPLEFTTQMLVEPGALNVLKGYVRTINSRVRRCIAKLVESIAARTLRTKTTVARLHAVDRDERRTLPSRR